MDPIWVIASPQKDSDKIGHPETMRGKPTSIPSLKKHGKYGNYASFWELL
jgi:hypothetical protein